MNGPGKGAGNAPSEGYHVRPPRIRDLPARQQPRELVSQLGAENVQDDVLIAVLLRTGIPGTNVVELARGLLQKYGSLAELARAPIGELTMEPGMGPVKAQVLKCSLELARRLAQEDAPARREVRTPADAARVLREEARTREEEYFWVLLLDTKYRMLRPPQEVSHGLVDASLVHPREVFKHALRASSTAVVLVHNHPSGDPTPSTEDILVTRQLIDAGRLMEIEVLDHVILGECSEDHPDGFCSLRESGVVAFESG